MPRSAILKLLLLFLIGAVGFYMEGPEGLSNPAWHLLVIFFMTIMGAILNPAPIGVVVMLGCLTAVLTHTISLEQAFSGFSNHIVWLVILAFFMARGIIKSNLGKRVAYFCIAKIGGSITGVSYGLILTELFLAPFIPSASARGGGIIYPVAQALTDQYNFVTSGRDGGNTKIGAFFMQLCFQTNIITSAMFLTAMAGNPLIASLAKGVNINISIATWTIGTIVPGLCSLLLLPFIMQFLIKPQVYNVNHAPILAKTALNDMGPLSRHEIIVLLNFILLIVLWMCAEIFNIEATTTALLGVMILVLTGVISWDDAMGEKEAWRTFIWFGGIIMLSKMLSDFGVTSWMSHCIDGVIGHYNPMIAIPLTFLIYFYMHYFFASITVYASVAYVTFLLLLVALGLDPIIAALSLAIASNLSACLTQYGITTAPIFFAASKLSAKKWWGIGLVMSFFHIIVWGVVGSIWWKALGWW